MQVVRPAQAHAPSNSTAGNPEQSPAQQASIPAVAGPQQLRQGVFVLAPPSAQQQQQHAAGDISKQDQEEVEADLQQKSKTALHVADGNMAAAATDTQTGTQMDVDD